jgi:hypothetical protein
MVAVRGGAEVAHQDKGYGRGAGVASQQSPELLLDVRLIQPHVGQKHEKRVVVFFLPRQQPCLWSD